MYHGDDLPRTLRACIHRQAGAAPLQHSNQLNLQGLGDAEEKALEPPPETPCLLEHQSDRVSLQLQPA